MVSSRVQRRSGVDTTPESASSSSSMSEVDDQALYGNSAVQNGVCDAEYDPVAEAAVEQAEFESQCSALVDHIPSTGLGKFDATYCPPSPTLDITVSIFFDFTEADDAPGLLDFVSRSLSGEDLSSYYWSDQEKTDFVSDFTANMNSAWSGQHEIACIRPHWEHYRAVPEITVVEAGAKADAHYAVTVHKVSDAEKPFVYRSGIHNEHLTDPSAQPTADFWETDNDTNSDFRSGLVATDERERLEAALAASGAGRLLFQHDSDELMAGEAAKLGKFADALLAAYDNAPLISVDIEGYASADGASDHNLNLSADRAIKVESILAGRGVRQSTFAMGLGERGSEGDANERCAELKLDRSFETSYTSNEYSVGAHEFGHLLGVTDEYRATEGGALAGARTRYESLMTSAGVAQPAWGDDTSSIMSAGVDVLPRHYVTLWEALAKITDPYITQSEWVL